MLPTRSLFVVNRNYIEKKQLSPEPARVVYLDPHNCDLSSRVFKMENISVIIRLQNGEQINDYSCPLKVGYTLREFAGSEVLIACEKNYAYLIFENG